MKKLLTIKFYLVSMSLICTMSLGLVGMDQSGILESLDVTTKDGKIITLGEPIVSSATLAHLVRLHEHIDGKLTVHGWSVVQDLCMLQALVQEQTGLELNLTDSETHLFNKYAVEKNDAPLVLRIGSKIFSSDSAAIIVALNAYVVFSKGAIDSVVIKQLSASLQKVLDKYVYLHYGRHLSVTKRKQALVSLAEYLAFNPTKKSCLASDGAQAHVELAQHSLADLDGWHSLFSQKIKPMHITVIDLSNNGLHQLDPHVLDGFINLEKIFLNHNKLTSLPDNLFNDCNGLKELYVQHNRLHHIRSALLKKCNQLVILVIYNNRIRKISKKLLANKPNLKEIHRDSTMEQPKIIGAVLVKHSDAQEQQVCNAIDYCAFGICKLIGSSLYGLPKLIFIVVNLAFIGCSARR